MEGRVDPAPGRFLADGLGGQAMGEGEHPLPGVGEAADDRRRAASTPTVRGDARCSVSKFAVVVVVVGRPDAGRHGARRVVDGELQPVGDVADVLRERPVRATGVGRRRARQVPGGVVETGPGRGHAVPQRGLVRPHVARRGAQVARADGGQRGARAGPRSSSAVIAPRSAPRRRRPTPRAGRRARRCGGRPPRRPRTGRSAAAPIRARGAPPPRSRPAR